MNQQVKPPAGWTEIEPEFDHQRQTFQRRRDGLVLAIEREGRSSYNVVTLPENYHQDNQVIDYVEVGLKPENAAEPAREWMEQNNATMDVTLTEHLSAVDNIDDPRSEAMRISMAEHFEDFEYEYRQDPHTDAEVVHEDDQVIVVADNTGHELAEWMSDFNMTGEHRDAFYSWNHEVARELTDHDWAVVDPVVFDKLV
jgi:hypothetical protein